MHWGIESSEKLLVAARDADGDALDGNFVSAEAERETAAACEDD
jgi:hypothetical protein